MALRNDDRKESGKDDRKTVGAQCEAHVVEYLRQKALFIEQQNWVGLTGEIDLIYVDHQTLVFVEVRSVRSKWLDQASLAVSPKKQRQVARCADEYIRKRLASLPSYQEIRFDVAGVLWEHDQKQLDYIENAFESPWAY